MTSRTLSPRLPALTDSLLAATAWRVGVAAARRVRVGSLTIILPDGTRHMFGDRAWDSGARSTSTTAKRSCGCCSAAKLVVAKPTWTGSGRAQT